MGRPFSRQHFVMLLFQALRGPNPVKLVEMLKAKGPKSGWETVT